MGKQKGLIALVSPLNEPEKNGNIAKHDLLLRKLIKYFPKEIPNYFFENDITHHECNF